MWTDGRAAPTRDTHHGISADGYETAILAREQREEPERAGVDERAAAVAENLSAMSASARSGESATRR